jgi:hypothetical protein
VVGDDDAITEHCDQLFSDINRAWDPLLSSAVGLAK